MQGSRRFFNSSRDAQQQPKGGIGSFNFKKDTRDTSRDREPMSAGEAYLPFSFSTRQFGAHRGHELSRGKPDQARQGQGPMLGLASMAPVLNNTGNFIAPHLGTNPMAMKNNVIGNQGRPSTINFDQRTGTTLNSGQNRGFFAPSTVNTQNNLMLLNQVQKPPQMPMKNSINPSFPLSGQQSTRPTANITSSYNSMAIPAQNAPMNSINSNNPVHTNKMQGVGHQNSNFAQMPAKPDTHSFLSDPNSLGHNQISPDIESSFVNILNQFLPYISRQAQPQLKVHESNVANPQENQAYEALKSIYQSQELDYAAHYRYRRKKTNQSIIYVNVINQPRITQAELARRSKQMYRKLAKGHPIYEQIENQCMNPRPRGNCRPARVGSSLRSKFEEVYKAPNPEAASEEWKVSEFGEMRKLQYTVDLKWSEEMEKVRRKFSKGVVSVPENPTHTEINEAIILDLERKGHRFKKDGLLIVKEDFGFQQVKKNILYRLFGPREKQFSKDYYMSGSIVQKKINLPDGYSCSPPQFTGFVVKSLRIQNQHGRIQWLTQVDVQNVDFSNRLSISEFEVQCLIPALEKPAIVSFFNLPAGMQSLKDTKVINRGLMEMVGKSRGGDFLGYDAAAKCWRVKVDFSREQKPQAGTASHS